MRILAVGARALLIELDAQAEVLGLYREIERRRGGGWQRALTDVVPAARTILLDGCSKTFAMTGWRCGFAAVPEFLAGLIATVVALPSMPENFAPGPAPPLDFSLPLGPIGVVLVAIVVALAIAVSVADRLVVSRASAERLGGDQ